MRSDEMMEELVARLTQAAGAQLCSVVLHGPLVHGDRYRAGQAHLLIVLADLELETLRPLTESIRWWRERGQPWPRLFTRELLADSADVFPIELLDIARHHEILYGDDPVAGITVDDAALRLQCERELRELLMRLREGYVECGGKSRELGELLAMSFASFARVFRAVLHLLGAVVPAHDHDVIGALCTRLDLDRALFDGAERVATGGPVVDAEIPFARFLRALQAVVARVDGLVMPVKPPTERSAT